MIKRILVPMIGSDLADAAFDCAFHLAKKCKASLDLLYAIEIASTAPRIPMASLLAPPGRLLEDLSRDAAGKEVAEKEKARLVIEGFESRCRSARIKVTSSVAPGYQGDEILRRQRVADLVCMENPGVKVKRKHLRRANLMLARITRLAARPIVFISSPFAPFETVVVAYDGSQEATKAIKVVTELPRKGVRVILLTVTKDAEEGDRILAEGREYLAPYGIDAEPVRVQGRQGRAILDAARDLGAGLIVMGAFGQNSLTNFLFGSTTEHLLSWSEIPLLVCH